jgi:hypothetical protein
VADDDKGGDGAPDLKATIREVLAEMLPKSGAAKGGAAGAGDVSAQVAAAVEKVRAGDAQRARDEQTEQRIAALEAKKQTPEKTPKQYRRITTALWGSDDDDD